MDDAEFDNALVTAAFALAATDGWKSVTPAAAARNAGLPLDQARARFPTPGAILMRFGRLADQFALSGSDLTLPDLPVSVQTASLSASSLATGASPPGAQPTSADSAPHRDRLFDIVMRRFDALQLHRAGIRAVIRALPAHPALTLGLGLATQSSMAWMLEGAGISATGLRGLLRIQGLTAVWLYTLRAWDRDDSADLSGTMAALDRALSRAEQVADLLAGTPPPAKPKPFPEDPAHEPPPAGAMAI